MYRSRNKISKKAILFKMALFVFVIGLLFLYSHNETSNNVYSLSKVAFLYEGDELVGINTDEQAEALKTTQKETAESITDGNDNEAVTTNVVNSPSLISFEISSDEQTKTIDYAKTNTALLEGGYTISIDNKYKYYIEDKESIEWLVSKILLAYMPNKDYLDYYETTGNFKSYTIDDKKFTGLSIDNEVSIHEGYLAGSRVVKSKEDLLFDLFHKDQALELDYIDTDTSLKDIKEDNELSDINFKLNNPNLAANAVTYDGQSVVTNQLNPVIDIAQTFETTETEEVEFDTVQKIDDSMLQGQFEVTTEGQNGVKEITYENKIVNGEVVSTEAVDEEVIEKPVHRVVSMGEGTIVNSVTVEGNSPEIDPSQITSSGFIWPSSSRSVTCEYGGYAGHTGIDIQDYYGAPEYAAKDGIVVTSGWSNYGYGYHVIIDHGNGVKTLYAHQNQPPPVQVGQYVQQGQIVGFEGATGNVTGEHLHFEVRINGSAVNPRPYITSEPAYNMGSVCS